MAQKVITRFPPSPTGAFHIGSARTALFNYLFAAHEGGAMHLRFEDTDRERSKKEYEKDVLDGLRWLGIRWDGEVLRQSERRDLYRSYIKKLIERGAAYEGEEATEGGGKRVVRFKNPNTTLTFSDIIRGAVTFDTTELKDFIVAKSTEEPLYHLAVVIDDFETRVTHVIRGEDHISNTPRQILILEALGFPRPVYAHIPLILAPDRSKLSKRHGAVSLHEYRARGFIAEAVINYLALLGWSPSDNRELFTLRELEREFSLERVHKNGAVFDIEKLTWFNHEHLAMLSDAEYVARLRNFAGSRDLLSSADPRLVPLLKERARTLGEAADMLGNELGFMGAISYEPALLTKGAGVETEAVKRHLDAVSALLEKIPDQAFTPEKIKEAIYPYATREDRGAVLWPLRVALSGRDKSPDPFTIAAILGKGETLRRIEVAIKML